MMRLAGVVFGGAALVLARSQIRYLLLADAVQAQVLDVDPRATRITWSIHGVPGQGTIPRRRGDTVGDTVEVRVLAGDPPRIRRPSWRPALLTLGLALAAVGMFGWSGWIALPSPHP